MAMATKKRTSKGKFAGRLKPDCVYMSLPEGYTLNNGQWNIPGLTRLLEDILAEET
jgi:hypothetical protein